MQGCSSFTTNVCKAIILYNIVICSGHLGSPAGRSSVVVKPLPWSGPSLPDPATGEWTEIGQTSQLSMPG